MAHATRPAFEKHMGKRPGNEDIPMKKTRVFLLALVLTVATLLCAMTVLAQENPTVTFEYTVAGQTVVCAEKTAMGGAVTMPDAPELLKGFVGWYAEIDGVAHLLPAGGVCNAVTADTVFKAFSVDFSTDTTEKTASVRLRDGDVALRFMSSVSIASYEDLTDIVGKQSVSFGTYIVPLSYVKKEFTLQALAAGGYTQYIDVPAGAFYSANDTHYTVAGSVGHIRYDHYTLKYTAIGYMKVKYTDGTEGTVYAAYNRDKNQASVAKTVLLAYEDRSAEQTDVNKYSVVTPSGTSYSRFTTDELALCEDFLNKIALVGVGFGSDNKYQYFVYKTKYYVSPWSVSYVLDPWENATITVTAPQGRTIDEIMGIYVDGARFSLKNATVTDGKLVFERSSYIG